eukprot:TRINITY_DN27897_c0_g1_i2.p1 TRINITY_DN27897_c0_g1~~TRINITY_DN27897_c0_g1_i2.p1  ORF type:complete len:137 (-),score=36.36 TRINITY_DN27897_c0_g1_i2:24-434(-)
MYLNFVFFFKQKTAYEMLRSLVGSEMCIRDRQCQSEQFRNQGFLAQSKAASEMVGKVQDKVAGLREELTRLGVLEAPPAPADPGMPPFTLTEGRGAVSYTHLTLPTKRIVENSVVAASIQNNKNHNAQHNNNVTHK